MPKNAQYAKICLNMSKYAQICSNMSKYAPLTKEQAEDSAKRGDRWRGISGVRVNGLQSTISSTVFWSSSDALIDSHTKGGKASFCGSDFVSCLCHNFRKVSRDVSVGIVTTLWAVPPGNHGSIPRQGQRVFYFTKTSTWALRPTLPHIEINQWLFFEIFIVAPCILVSSKSFIYQQIHFISILETLKFTS
jgi:hypothetical protein